MTPEYGTDIASALFENEDNFALACRAAINKAVALWIPEISITEINISEPNHDGECKISLTIELPNSNLTSINITSSYFGADGTISRTGA
jgi:phage baseplate assembly protein W